MPGWMFRTSDDSRGPGDLGDREWCKRWRTPQEHAAHHKPRQGRNSKAPGGHGRDRLNDSLQAWMRWLERVRPRRLAPRLLAAIVLASSALALRATGVQLYGDYRNDLAQRIADLTQP